MDFTVIIPARFASSRFPGKALIDIRGKAMVQHVYERALEAGASRVVVATDDTRIAEAISGFGGNVCLTVPTHESGTTRLAEAVAQEGLPPETIVVNVQGDEPFIPPENIRQVAENLHHETLAEMTTLCATIDTLEAAQSPHVTKVVRDKWGYALYFSRALIPFDRARFLRDDPQAVMVGDECASVKAQTGYCRHIGIYAYRANFITRYVKMVPSDMEQIEMLEQLRVLWHGVKIHVAMAVKPPPQGIDTPEDLARLLRSLDCEERDREERDREERDAKQTR